MRPAYVPPKGYSKPRNTPTAEVQCQRCGSSAHWTFECSVSAVQVEATRHQNIDQQQLVEEAPPDTRNPMWRPEFDDPTDESNYTTAELNEVKDMLREEVRKEILAKYAPPEAQNEEMVVEVDGDGDSTSDESD